MVAEKSLDIGLAESGEETGVAWFLLVFACEEKRILVAFPGLIIGDTPKDDGIDVGLFRGITLKDLLHEGLVSFALIVVFALAGSIDGDIDLSKLALQAFLLDELGIVDDVVHVGVRIKVGLETYSVDKTFGDGISKEAIEGPVAPSWLIVEGEVIVIKFLPFGFVFGGVFESVVDVVFTNG